MSNLMHLSVPGAMKVAYQGHAADEVISCLCVA